MASIYDQDELDALLERCADLLGLETLEALTHCPPREDVFFENLNDAIISVGGGPSDVSDAQILAALAITDEIWPVEAQAAADALAL